MKKVLIFLLFLMLFIPSLWADEELLYAIRYEGAANSPIKGKQISTQIFSINPDNKENKLVFSDENSSIALSVGPNVPGIREGEFVTSKKKIYGFAIERNIEIGYDSSLHPIYFYRFGMKSSIYEIFIDGTNRFRKVCDVMGTQYPTTMFIDPTGTRIGYLNYSDKACKKQTLFIHHTLSGKLFNEVELAEIFLECFPTNIGWLPDGGRLFFTLDAGAVGVTSEESYQRIGTYFMKENGTDVARLPDSLFSFRFKNGFSGGLTPRCIGVNPDGTLIIRDVRHKRGDRGGVCSFLYLVDLDTKSKKEIPMKVFEGLKCFKISHDGTKIAFIEDIYEDDSIHIWVKDLKTGKENKIFSFPIRPFKGYYLGLVGWIED